MSKNAIIKSLQTQEAKIWKIIDHRNNYVADRSEAWQESDKCDEYEDITAEIESAVNELEYAIDALEELLL